jgi:hypothetical protein
MKEHASDCALHNGPAEIPEICSCGVDPYIHPLTYGSEYPDRSEAIKAFLNCILENAPKEKPSIDYDCRNSGDIAWDAKQEVYWELAQMIKRIPPVPCYTIDGKRYAESIEAERGHYRYCEKYAAMRRKRTLSKGDN